MRKGKIKKQTKLPYNLNGFLKAIFLPYPHFQVLVL